MKLSIIVPIYGVEKYVRKCILSIIEQDDNLFNETELIIVNDGTKDNSIAKIQDIVDKFDNIKLINQKNQGLSVARNNGMAIAKGDYIWFIDSDDWISKESIKVLKPHLNRNNDIIVIGANWISDKTNTVSNIYSNEIETLSGREAYKKHFEQVSTSVLAIYRKKFLQKNNLFFFPEILHEDNEFCPKASYLSDMSTYLPYVLYFVRCTKHDGHKSITMSVNSKRAFDILKVASLIASFSKNQVRESYVKTSLDNQICVDINNALEIISLCDKCEQSKFNYIFKNRYLFLINNLRKGKLKNKIEAILIILFSKNIVQVYKFLQFFKS